MADPPLDNDMRREAREIKARLVRARREAGLSQRELAERLGIHRNTLQYWETTHNDFAPYGELEAIAEATGTSSVWLLRGEESAPVSEALERLLGELEEAMKQQLRVLAQQFADQFARQERRLAALERRARTGARAKRDSGGEDRSK